MNNEELLIQANSELNHLVMDMQEKLSQKDKQMSELLKQNKDLNNLNNAYSKKIKELEEKLQNSEPSQPQYYKQDTHVNLIQVLQNKAQQILSQTQNNFYPTFKVMTDSINKLITQISQQNNIIKKLSNDLQQCHRDRQDVKAFLVEFERFYQFEDLTLKDLAEIVKYQVSGYDDQIQKLLNLIQEQTK